jgi:hypothetical protein
MKKVLWIVGSAIVSICVLLAQPLTVPLGSPTPSLMDWPNGNPVRIGFGLGVTNRTLYVTNSGSGGTGITNGTPAGGILTGTYPNPFLIASGVTNGVYGGATSIPVFRVLTNGLISAVTNVAFSPGTTINSTNGRIPVRGSATAFTNSTLAYTTNDWLRIVDSNNVTRTRITPDGRILIGKTDDATWAPIASEVPIYIRKDENLGEDPSQYFYMQSVGGGSTNSYFYQRMSLIDNSTSGTVIGHEGDIFSTYELGNYLRADSITVPFFTLYKYPIPGDISPYGQQVMIDPFGYANSSGGYPFQFMDATTRTNGQYSMFVGVSTNADPDFFVVKGGGFGGPILNAPTNIARFTLVTNVVSVDTLYTNRNQRATVYQAYDLTSALLSAASVDLYVDDDADGSWDSIGLGLTSPVGVTNVLRQILSFPLQPGSRYAVSNSSGASSTVAPSGPSRIVFE